MIHGEQLVPLCHNEVNCLTINSLHLQGVLHQREELFDNLQLRHLFQVSEELLGLLGLTLLLVAMLGLALVRGSVVGGTKELNELVLVELQPQLLKVVREVEDILTVALALSIGPVGVQVDSRYEVGDAVNGRGKLAQQLEHQHHVGVVAHHVLDLTANLFLILLERLCLSCQLFSLRPQCCNLTLEVLQLVPSVLIVHL